MKVIWSRIEKKRASDSNSKGCQRSLGRRFHNVSSNQDPDYAESTPFELDLKQSEYLAP